MNIIGIDVSKSKLDCALIDNSNHRKFSPDHFSISVSLTLITLEDSRVQIQGSVTDSGIGMTQDQINLLFQSFVQVDYSSSRKFEGTGLGLAICKKLTKLMNGEIWLESKPNQGSTFRFNLLLTPGQRLERDSDPNRKNSELFGIHNSDYKNIISNDLRRFGCNSRSPLALRTTGIQNYLRLPGTTSPRVRFPSLAAVACHQIKQRRSMILSLIPWPDLLDHYIKHISILCIFRTTTL